MDVLDNTQRFRLYMVHAYKNNAREPIKDGTLIGQQSLMDFVISSLTRLQGHVISERPTLMLKPEHFINRVDPQKGDPCFLLTDFTVYDRVIQARISKGHYGELNRIVDGVNDTSESIENKAATRDFWVRMAFPKDKNVFFMVTQMRGLSQGGSDLLHQISHQSVQAVSRLVEDDVVRTGDWYKLLEKPFVDENRYDSVLNESRVEKISLTRQGIDDTGQRNGGGKIHVEAVDSLRKDDRRPFEQLRSWFKVAEAGRKPDPHEGAKQVSQLFPPGLINGNQEWDEGSITIVEKGHPMTISTKSVERLFLYPVDGDTLDDLWTEANRKLQDASQGFGVHIPAIDIM